MTTNSSPLAAPRRQLSSITNTAPQQQRVQNIHSAPSSSSSSAVGLASTAPRPGTGSPGSTKSKIATPLTSTGTATLVPGRRPQYPQYQLTGSSRLDSANTNTNSNNYVTSSHHPQYQQQQQQQGVSSGLPGASPGSSSALKPPPSHHARISALQQQPNRQNGPRGLPMAGTHTNTQTMNAHTQLGATTTGVTATGVTGMTGTTGATGMTDKPKSRKKDKPPRLPPPDVISDNNLMIRYVRGPSLGEGGFASCFLITDEDGNRYAAKVIQKTELQSHKTRQKLFAEIKIHQSLKHENIVRYHNCFEDEDFVYLVLELCESKTLMDLIKRRKRLTEPEVRYYMRELVEGCSYLHQQKTIHRDLKLGNLFLTHDMHVRIGDFGLAAVILNEERKKTICGTPNYIAPEILFDTDNGHSFEVDIWSVGVIMYTLLVGKPPFQTNEVKAIYKKIRDNDYVFPDDVPISEEAKDLIRALLSPTPSSRPSVGDVLSHPFFSSGYFPDVLDRKTLLAAPNFEQEERMIKDALHQQQQQSEDIVEVLEDAANQDVQQGHVYDPPTPPYPKYSPSSQSTRRYSEVPSELAEITPFSSPSGKKSIQAQSHHPMSTRSATLAKQQQQQQQQQQQSSPLPHSPFHYGEQVKIELVDGDRVTTEIRTINMDRGRAASSTQQQLPLGNNTRLQQQEQRKPNQQVQQQQQQRQSATASPLVSRNESLSAYNIQQVVKTEGSPQGSPTAKTTSFGQQSRSQASITRSGVTQSLSLSPSSRIETASGVPAPSSSSRLPVPKSRLNTGSPQQGGQHQSSTELLASTPTKSSFGHAMASPKPASSMTMSSSAPNMPAQLKSTTQKATCSSPTSNSKRQPSDTAAMVSSGPESSVKPSSQGRRLETMSNDLDAAQAMDIKFRQLSTGGMDVDADIDMDMDMEIDPNLPKNTKISPASTTDMMHQPMVHDGGKGQQQQPQKLRHLTGSSLTQGSQQGSQHARSRTTLIQTVYGVERPASAMQRTHHQDGEGSDVQTVSPHKTTTSTHAPSTESSLLTRRPSQSSLHSSSQQQQQRHQQRHQHSFLHTSQQGVQSSPETNYHPSIQLPRAPPSPTLRLSHRKSQQWSSDAFISIQPHHSSQELLPEHERDPTSPVFSQQLQQHRQRPIGLGLSQPDEAEVLGGMASSAIQGNMSMTDEDSSGSGYKQQQALATPQRRIQRRQSQQFSSVDDPHRSQFTNSLQRRNQQVKQQQQQQQQQQQLMPSLSPGGSLGMSNGNNNPNKQSNETTMGMSTGGHSDEQDQVEVPSTSCVTTTSMSLSMHHDHLHHQKHQSNQQQQQQQAQDAQAKTLAAPQPEGTLKRKTKKVTVLDPPNQDLHLRRVGTCEAVEKFLRNIIRSRQEGIWITPDMEEPAPSHPSVFVTRWIDYERYGYGWQLSNGVVGVIYNDRTTLALSPNGVDIEVTESPNKRKRRNGSSSTNFLRRRSYADLQSAAQVQRKEPHFLRSMSSLRPYQDLNHSGNPPAAAPQRSRSMAAIRADLRAGLEYERRSDGGGEYQLMMIYDDKNNLLTPSASRSAGGGEGGLSMTNGGSSSVALKTEENDYSDGSFLTEALQDQDFYDEWDYGDFLETLDRTYCRMHSKEIPRLAKRIKVLEGFRNYMAHWLVSLSPWVYQDLTLTRGLPFMTDLYRRKEKKHVIVRLSNGIVQVNFADHSKLIFSQNGEVVTLIDSDEISRRITMKTYQALSPEYFYDRADEHDQQKLVVEELRQIESNLLQQRYDSSRGESEENRPIFQRDRDQDLTLFPRPYLRAKAAKQEQSYSPHHKRDQIQDRDQDQDGEAHDDQHGNKLSISTPIEYPVVDLTDATLVELRDINKEDGRFVILDSTLKQLHFELVRRIRLALRLLVARKMDNAQDRMKVRLENEQYLKDRDESRRRRAAIKEQKEKEGEKTKVAGDAEDEPIVIEDDEEDEGNVDKLKDNKERDHPNENKAGMFHNGYLLEDE